MAGEAVGVFAAIGAVGGSQTELARRVGVTQQAVQQWVERGEIPPLRVLDVARATGLRPSRLAPELFQPCPTCGE